MKITTRFVLDFETLGTIQQDSFEYEGPVAQCGGIVGKSTPKVTTAPSADETPTYETTKDPISQSVRDAEAAKLRQRRGLAGTILTSPLGTTYAKPRSSSV